MLGRYVAGTLLILGAAMVMAPETPPSEGAEVARANSTPAAVPAGQAEELAEAARNAVPVSAPAEIAATPAEATTSPTTDSAESAELKAGIEDALVAALAIDDAQGGALANDNAAPLPGATDGEEVASLAATGTGGVWQGLSDVNAVTEINATESAGAEAPVDPVKQMFVTGSRVNVRSGPSTDFGVVGTVVEGDAVELVSDGSGNWAEIRYSDGATGFMSRRFLSEAVDG